MAHPGPARHRCVHPELRPPETGGRRRDGQGSPRVRHDRLPAVQGHAAGGLRQAAVDGRAGGRRPAPGPDRADGGGGRGAHDVRRAAGRSLPADPGDARGGQPPADPGGHPAGQGLVAAGDRYRPGRRRRAPPEEEAPPRLSAESDTLSGMAGNEATTFPAVVEQAAARHGDREALVDGELRLSFTELAAAADRAARAYLAAGVEPGDRVALWAPNSAGWVVAALGAFRAGAVIVTVNSRFKGQEAAHVVRTAGARLLVTVTDFLGSDYVALLAAAGAPECLETTVVLTGPVPGGSVGWDDFLAVGDAVDPAGVAERSAAGGPPHLSTIIFTSGTTGAPKGAMLRHGASVRAYTAWAEVVGLAAGDRYLIVNPFFHCFGLNAGILACLITGTTMIPHPVFDVPSVMARVDEERVTMLPGAPAIYQTMLDHPDLGRYDLSTLRLAVTGAATVPVEMIRRMRSELTFRTIVTGYGLTESHGIATMCRHTDDPETIARTSGRALPGGEARLVAGDGKEVATGEPGEVVVRGYTVMGGSFGDPAATAEAVDA